MVILYTSLIAFLIGIFLFVFILPRAIKLVRDRIWRSERIEMFEKIRIANLLDQIKDGQFRGKSQQSVRFLSLSFLALLGMQHYFLIIKHGTEAKIIVGGMFLLLITHILYDA